MQNYIKEDEKAAYSTFAKVRQFCYGLFLGLGDGWSHPPLKERLRYLEEIAATSKTTTLPSPNGSSIQNQ